MGLYDETEVDEALDAEDTEDTEDAGDAGTKDSENESRLKRLEESNALNEIVSDPDVQRVLALKKSGKKVFVDEPKEEEEADEFAVDDDDPAAELLKKIGGMMDSKLSGLKGRVEVIETIAQRAASNEVNGEIKRVRDKNADFDTYKDSMVKMSQENPGLNVEELYTMAKMRAGKLDLVQPQTFSEKGTTQPRRGLKKAGGTVPRGRQGFNKIVQKALQGLNLDSLE